MKPLIAVYALGGTIASVPGADGTRANPSLSPGELITAVPQLRAVADIDTLQFRQFPSSDLSITDIIELAGDIDKRITAAYDGVVITQGTDTLEETSFLLDLLLEVPVPVVMTGAMRNPGLPGADGPANIEAAVRVACSSDATDMGVLVVFNDEIHSARWVAKTHTSSVATFESRNGGPVGWVNEGRVRIPLVQRQRLQKCPLPVGTEVPEVALVTLALGTDARMIDTIVDSGYKGAVIESYGGGHASRRLVSSLTTLAHKIPVVLSSRTGEGEILRHTYGYVGSESDLLERGLISAGILDGLKARLLLTAALAAGETNDQIADRFATAAG